MRDNYYLMVISDGYFGGENIHYWVCQFTRILFFQFDVDSYKKQGQCKEIFIECVGFKYFKFKNY